MIRNSFKKALCLFCTVAIIASTLVVMSVSAMAATISSDKNVFTSLETKETETYTFQTESGDDISGAASAGNGKAIPGVASALNCLAGSTNKLYLRVSNRNTAANATLAMKWASPTTQKSGVMLGKTGSNIGSGTDQAYVLEDNTTYEISYDYINWNGTGLSLNLLGVSHASNIVLQDLEDEHTYTVLNSTSIDATAASKVWTTYTCKFTTGTLGNDKYLSFAVFREATTSLEFWLDNVKVSKVAKIDSKDVITFNDNGKTYYAYPDALTALPDGDNGALGSEFIGWVDADGNAVTEVPEAGTVLNAKYPFVTELPEKTDSLYLALTNTSEQNNIAHIDAKGILGVVSSSNSSHRIYSRNLTIADGSSAIIIKFANNWTSSRTVTFGKANVAADGADNAFVVEPNTKYTVSYNIKHESGAGVSFDIIAGAATNATSGYVFDSYAPETAANVWTVHTCSFTTPDAATLGANKYLQFAITVPEGEAISNVAYLYGVTITKVSAGDPADYITFVDGDETYYAEAGTISALPKGQLGDDENEFLGWYDGNGKRVTEVPAENGTVLTSRYGPVDPGLVAVSIREVKGTGADYQSAGIRFRGRLANDIVESASEIGFILVPKGTSVDSNIAIKAVNKSADEHIIYDLTYDGYTDYQVILTGLTREGSTTSLCGLQIEAYFYYVIDGVRYFEGEPCAKSYNDVVAMMEADLPVVNNNITEISTAPTGAVVTDKLTSSNLTLTPPEYNTVLGSASYVDATDNATLMTVTDTSKVEYEAYLKSLEDKGYTAVVGNSRILSSSPSFSAIYSDGTNLINIAYIDAYKEVKVTVEPIGYTTVDDVNDYLSVFHTASSAKPENAVCDPLLLTIGTSGSELNSDADFYHGLGYIYRLCDGTFVIIDGGNDSDVYDHAGKIYSMLKYYAPDPENIVISAWIMTHAHGDHMYVFKSFAPKYLADESYNVTLNSIIANLPNEAWIASSGMPETNLAPFRTLFAECKARGTKVYKAHIGQVYNFAGFTAEMLYSLEQTAPAVENKNMSNTSSLIFRVVTENKSFMFTADATSTSITFVNDAFGAKMKSDFVQTPHHGTCSNFSGDAALAELTEFYNSVNADYVLWSAAAAGMNYYLTESNPNSVYGNSVPYENNIALGHNIKSIKLNAETIEIDVVDYYEIGYLKTEPIAISTEEEFKAIGENLSGYYYLTKDITITETVTTPYWGSAFKGYLDGKGFTVTFANAIDHACASPQSGILCTTVQGVIRNISFGSESAPIVINYSATSSGAMGLFGSTRSNVTFDTVKVYSDITYTVDGGIGNYVGGFLGRVYCSTSNTASVVVFKNCEFNGTYTESGNTNGNLKAFGGLVGGQTDLNVLTVENCAVNATVNAKCSTANSGVGGFVGRLQKTYITNINNTTVSGTINGRSYAGGIIGTVQPSTGKVVISGCTVDATVSGGTAGEICGNAGTITTIK